MQNAECRTQKKIYPVFLFNLAVLADETKIAISSFVSSRRSDKRLAGITFDLASNSSQ
jgi:hypothetical protein